MKITDFEIFQTNSYTIRSEFDPIFPFKGVSDLLKKPIEK